MSDPPIALDANISVPDNVVFRSFPNETVLLHLGTGRYHGVDGAGGRMLELLVEHKTIAAAAGVLAEEFEATEDQFVADLRELCAQLLERKLVAVEGG